MLAIGKLTVRAALGSPLFALLALALGAAIAALPRVTFFGFGEEARLVRDAGASALRVAGLVMAIAFGIAGGPERDAEALLLSRPITAARIVLGRFAGALVATFVMLSMLSAVLYGTLRIAGLDAGGVPGDLGRAALESVPLVAAGAAIGTVLPRGLAAVALLALFALAHAAPALDPLLPGADGPPAAALLAATAWVAAAAAAAEAREATA